MRDLDRCQARPHANPWGGNGAFDRLRLALTERALRRVAPDRRPLDVAEIGFGRGDRGRSGPHDEANVVADADASLAGEALRDQDEEPTHARHDGTRNLSAIHENDDGVATPAGRE
jgi:hypothetical protein